MALAEILVAAGPIFIIAGLAMPAGIGGGVLYVPLLLVLRVVNSPRASTALSQSIVVGASLAANVFNLVRQWRHPEERLVEPDLVLAAVPACLAGTMVGTLLNEVLPELVILGMLLLVIGVSMYRVLRKGLSLWRAENAESARTLAATDPPLPGQTELEVPCRSSTSLAGSSSAGSNSASAGSMVLLAYSQSTLSLLPDGLSPQHRRSASSAGQLTAAFSGPWSSEMTEASRLPPVEEGRPKRGGMVWLWLWLVWLVFLAALLLRGGRGASSVVGIAQCSPAFWAVTGTALGIMLTVGLLARCREVAVGGCFFVGLLSAIVGIGGGIVLNPMLLSAGVNPMKTTATVAVMICMITTSATTAFLFSGAIEPLPMLVLSIAAFLGSFLGKVLVSRLVAKTGRSSLLVFLLAGFMAVSGIMVAVQGIIRTADEVAQGTGPSFVLGDPCS